MNKKTLMVVLSILAIAIWIGILFGWLHHGDVTLKSEQTFGEVLAEEVAKLVQNQGNIVIIREPEQKNKPSIIDIQIKSLESALKKFASIKVSVEPIVMSRMPISPEVRLNNPLAEPSIGLSSDDVLKVMQSHPDANAYVLFGSLPAIDPQRLKSSNHKSHQWVVLSDYEPHYSRLFKSEVIGLVIAPRSGPRSDVVTESKTARDRFAQDYEVITSAR